MKTISPISIWQNGQNIEALYLKAEVQADNLIDYASFNYMLLDADFINVRNGIVGILGQDYIYYQTNQYAWDYIATSLNLTIIGDYVPSVVEPIVAETATVVETPIVSDEIITE